MTDNNTNNRTIRRMETPTLPGSRRTSLSSPLLSSRWQWYQGGEDPGRKRRTTTAAAAAAAIASNVACCYSSSLCCCWERCVWDLANPAAIVAFSRIGHGGAVQGLYPTLERSQRLLFWRPVIFCVVRLGGGPGHLRSDRWTTNKFGRAVRCPRDFSGTSQRLFR